MSPYRTVASGVVVVGVVVVVVVVVCNRSQMKTSKCTRPNVSGRRCAPVGASWEKRYSNSITKSVVVCHSLPYPGPLYSLMSVVEHDAFQQALGDPSLRLRISDKSPTIMEEALPHLRL